MVITNPALFFLAAVNRLFTLSAGETTTIAQQSLDALKTTISAFVSWFGEFLTFVANQPLLLIGIAIFVASAVIYLTYKALHGRG